MRRAGTQRASLRIVMSLAPPAPPFIKSDRGRGPAPPRSARAVLDAAPSAGWGFRGRRREGLGEDLERLWASVGRRQEGDPDRLRGDGVKGAILGKNMLTDNFCFCNLPARLMLVRVGLICLLI